jgi:hypothetical protein
MHRKTLKTGIKGRGKFLKGWSKISPGTHARTVMLHKCGKKCFLGPNKSFPICAKNTCRINKKGVYAAYIRAREYSTIKGTRKYSKIASRAKRLL